MGRKLYVGNLPFSVTELTLQSTFAQHGTVETVNLITDRDTGQSKGFGFVEMRTDAEASAAISALSMSITAKSADTLPPRSMNW